MKDSKSKSLIAPAAEFVRDDGSSRISVRCSYKPDGLSSNAEPELLFCHDDHRGAWLDDEQAERLAEYLVGILQPGIIEALGAVVDQDCEPMTFIGKLELMLQERHAAMTQLGDDMEIREVCPDGSVWLCSNNRIRYMPSPDTWLPQDWTWHRVGDWATPDGAELPMWEAWCDVDERVCGYDGYDNLKDDGCEPYVSHAVARANAKAVEALWAAHYERKAKFAAEAAAHDASAETPAP